MGLAFPCCALQQAGKRKSFQQRKAVLGPQPQCYCALRSAWFCQAASARREDRHTVRKKQQKAVVAEQPALRAAARRHADSATHASTPAMATSSSLGQDNVWLQSGKAARSWSSLRHPRQNSGSQEGWDKVSRLQGALLASKFKAGGFTSRKHRRTAGDPSEVTSWAAPICGVVMALAHEHKELRKEGREPRSKEMLAKHEESLPLVSVSSTKKIPPLYQSKAQPLLGRKCLFKPGCQTCRGQPRVSQACWWSAAGAAQRENMISC